MLMNRKINNKYRGFTLAELLIVVAIIAVLVAVAIPVFTAQLNKAKYATDLANSRSIYAILTADYLANGKNTYMLKLFNKEDECIYTLAEDQGTFLEIDSGSPSRVEVYDADGNLTETYAFTGVAAYIGIAAYNDNIKEPSVGCFSEYDEEVVGSIWGSDEFY